MADMTPPTAPTAWRKPTYSAHEDCVEVSLPAWRKATASGAYNCVEVAVAPDEILVRNSRMPAGPKLHFTQSEWRAFLAGVKDNEFDLPETVD